MVLVKANEDSEAGVLPDEKIESKELVAGFWLWQVRSLDEAIEWLKRAPFEGTEVEIRPVYEFEDFGENLTPELREKNERLRKQVADTASR